MKLNELLGIEFPIIQGGMANIATGAFAAAVSNAGALGLVASGGMDAEALRAEIRAAKANTGKPFGVNLMLMNPHIDALAKVVAEEGVQVVTTGAGNPGKYVPAWKEAGIKVFPVVAAPILAKRLERYGIDGVIAVLPAQLAAVFFFILREHPRAEALKFFRVFHCTFSFFRLYRLSDAADLQLERRLSLEKRVQVLL